MGNSQIRILFTIPNFVTAGSGGTLFDILEKLDRQKFKPYVCIKKAGGKYETKLKELGITILIAPFTTSPRPYYKFIFKAWKISLFFKQYNFDIWHSFNYLDDYTEPIIARLAGVKNWIYTKTNMNWYQNSWYLRSLLATRIITINHDMEKLFFNTPKRKRKSVYIPVGIDTEKFSPATPSQFNLREKYKIPQNHQIILSVGHIVPIKGHLHLIKAIALHENTSLFIAGRQTPSPYLLEIKKLINNLKLQSRVFLLGEIGNIHELLPEIDLFVMPSITKGEGLGIALLEAMSCKKACIASNVPGCRDIIKNKINGILVQPENPKALSKAIIQLSLDIPLQKQLGLEAKKTIESNFSIVEEVANHVTLYESIMNPHAK